MTPSIIFNSVSYQYENAENAVFNNITLNLPPGITSFVGQNGTGKSTLLLLGSGRFLPQSGSVLINGIDTTSITDELQRNKLASIVYQNMEFETEDTIEELLPFVLQSGNLEDESYIREIIDSFDLKSCLTKKFQENSKGDMQKICIAFSLLYGSPYVFMDEPVFALEHKWKESILDYLKEFSRKENISIIYSLHELDLSKKYSDNTVLFSKDKSLLMGPSSQILQREYLEEAYQVPMELLYQRESLFREHLRKPLDPETYSGQNVKVID